MYEYFDLHSSKQVLLYYIIQINIQCVSCFMVEVSSKQIKCLNLYLDESFNLWYSRHTNDTCIYTCRLFICISGSRKIYSGGLGGDRNNCVCQWAWGGLRPGLFSVNLLCEFNKFEFFKGGWVWIWNPLITPPPPLWFMLLIWSSHSTGACSNGQWKRSCTTVQCSCTILNMMYIRNLG